MGYGEFPYDVVGEESTAAAKKKKKKSYDGRGNNQVFLNYLETKAQVNSFIQMSIHFIHITFSEDQLH